MKKKRWPAASSAVTPPGTPSGGEMLALIGVGTPVAGSYVTICFPPSPGLRMPYNTSAASSYSSPRIDVAGSIAGELSTAPVHVSTVYNRQSVPDDGMPTKKNRPPPVSSATTPEDVPFGGSMLALI